MSRTEARVGWARAEVGKARVGRTGRQKTQRHVTVENRVICNQVSSAPRCCALLPGVYDIGRGVASSASATATYHCSHLWSSMYVAVWLSSE